LSKKVNKIKGNKRLTNELKYGSMDNMMKGHTMLNTSQQEFVKHAYELFGKTELTTEELREANNKFGKKSPPQWLTKNKDYKLGRSLFKIK